MCILPNYLYSANKKTIEYLAKKYLEISNVDSMEIFVL